MLCCYFMTYTAHVSIVMIVYIEIAGMKRYGLAVVAVLRTVYCSLIQNHRTAVHQVGLMHGNMGSRKNVYVYESRLQIKDELITFFILTDFSYNKR